MDNYASRNPRNIQIGNTASSLQNDLRSMGENWWNRRASQVQSLRRFVEGTINNYDTTRYKIAIFLFFAAFMSFMLRVYFSVVIVVISKEVSSSVFSQPECSEDEEWADLIKDLTRGKEKFFKEKKISAYEETGTLTVFHCAYTLSPLIAELIVQKLGAVATVTAVFLLSGFATLALPYCTIHYIPGLYIIRSITGITTGMIIECFYRIILMWAPLTERKEFFDKHFGFHLGTAFTYLLCGLIFFNWHWYTIPIFVGISSVLFAFVWAVYVTDSPEDHLFIRESEIIFIRERLDTNLVQLVNLPKHIKLKRSLPLKQIVKCRAVWALFVIFWTHYWNYLFYLDYLPVYFFEILKFDLIPMCFFLGSMYLMKIVVGVVSVHWGNKYVLNYGANKLTMTRKGLTILSHLIPGLLLVFNVTAKCDRLENMGLVLTAMILNGAFMGGAFLNLRDLSPRFDFVLSNILINICNVGGVVVLCVYRLIDQKVADPVDRWLKMTVMNGFMYIVGGGIFIMFGSTDVQEWDTLPEQFENVRPQESFF